MCKDLKNSLLRRLILPSDSTLINIWWLASWLATIAIVVAFVWYLVTDHQSLTVVDFHLVENFGPSEAIAPLVGAAIASAAGGLLSSMIGAGSTSATNRLNYQMMQEQNRFNAAEAFKNREWQRDMYNLAWNNETSYNDPQNQMARLKQAGINPFMAAEGVAGFGQTHAPSAPSGAQASASPTIPMQNLWSNIGQNFTNFAELAKSLMEAKKASAEGDKTSTETQLLSEGMQSTLRTLAAQAETAEHQAYIANIQAAFEQLKQTKSIEKLEADTLEVISKTDLNAAEKEERISQMWKNVADSAKTREEANQIRLLTPVVVENAKKEGELIDEKKKTEQASQLELNTRARNNLSSAYQAAQQGRYYSALTMTENALRSSKVSFADAEQAEKWSDFLYNIGSLAYRLETEHWNSEKVAKEATKLDKELDTFSKGILGDAFEDIKKMLGELKNAASKKLDETTTPLYKHPYFKKQLR